MIERQNDDDAERKRDKNTLTDLTSYTFAFANSFSTRRGIPFKPKKCIGKKITLADKKNNKKRIDAQALIYF